MGQMLEQQRNLLIKLRELKLTGFAEMLEAQFNNFNVYAHSTFEERLTLCLDAQEDMIKQRRYVNLIKQAKLKDKLTFNDIMKKPSAGLTSQLIQSLTSNAWISSAQNIIIQGPTGVGKTALCCAIGFNVCKSQKSVYYTRTADLIELLNNQTGYHAKNRLIQKLSKVNVLILDEFGSSRPSGCSILDLSKIIDNREGVVPTILATQLKISALIDFLGGDHLAEGILDRLIHPSIQIKLEGESRRKDYMS